MPEWLPKLLTWLNTSAGLANWALVAVAIATAAIALRQVALARELQKEQARPYVVAGMRRVAHGIVELYVKNLGNTAAYDIHLESSPGLESISDADAFVVFDVLPTLVPNDEWATIWETKTPLRAASDAPERYEVTLSYSGRFGRRAEKYSDSYAIDWRAYLPSSYLEQKDMHDLVTTIERIHRSIGVDRNGQRDLVQSGHAIAEVATKAASTLNPTEADGRFSPFGALGRFALRLPFVRCRR